MNDVATGRCFCGNLQFEARAKPLWVAHCHCESCRRSTGAPVTTFIGFKSEQVTYTRGERKYYESSPGVQRGFCADCGTPMTYESERYPGEMHLYISTLDDCGAFVPKLHVYFAEHIPWMDIADDLPRYASTPKKDGEPSSWGPSGVHSGGGET